MSDQTNGISQHNPGATDTNNNSSKTPVPTVSNATVAMPLPMQLTNLATLPLALCAMNAPGNIGNTGLLQTATNIMAQPAGVQSNGIILLNLGGNTNNNVALSQLVPHFQQNQQTIQPQTVNPLLLGQNSIGLSAVQQAQTIPAAQPQAFHQVVQNAAQIQLPVATTSTQQTSATAFMLVPIPVANSTQASIAQQATTTQTAQVLAPSPAIRLPVHSPIQHNVPILQQQTSAPVQNNTHSLTAVAQQLLSNHVNNAANLPPLSGGQLNLQLPGTLPATPTTGNMPTLSTFSDAALNYLGLSSQLGSIATTAGVQTSGYPTNPIHDPHISSTMHTSPFTTGADSGFVQSNPEQCVPNSQEQLKKPEQVESPRISIESNSNECGTLVTHHPNPNSTPTTPCQVSDAQSINVQEIAEVYTPNKTPETMATGEDGVQKAETMQNWTVGLESFLRSPAGSEQGEKGKKRKKGPAPKLDGNEVCLICSDKASGYHYGVLTCEGCKGFFRRSIIKGSDYKCKGNGKCEMDAYSRRKCQKCRLERCRSAGMKDESVLSEAKAKRIKKEKDCSTPFQNVSFDGEPIPTLTPHQRNLVEMLQTNEARFQWPTQENVAKVTPWVETGDEHRIRASRFAHFTELSILIVQLVVEFTKQLPGFMSVSREDQIVLLKACTIEVMLLRAAKQFDKKTKAINFLNGKFYDRNSFYRAGIQVEFVDPIFDFCHSMARLDLDEAEYALLSAINTFSADRPNIKDIGKVEALQDSYVDLLRVYLKIHHPSDPLMFPRTLMKLVELRSLNNYHSEQMFALKVQDKQLPPLLAEIWDM